MQPDKIKLVLVLCLLFFINIESREIQKLDTSNYELIVNSNKLTFIAFTAEWCPFSRILLEVFKDFTRQYGDLYSTKNTVVAYVDCVHDAEICAKNSVNKFPTMKVFYFGVLLQEYRSARNVEALNTFLAEIEKSKSNYNYQEVLPTENQQQQAYIKIWYPRSLANFDTLLKASSVARGNIKILVPFDSQDFTNQETFIEFWDGEFVKKRFQGSVESFHDVSEWVGRVSSGFVRELQFSNAEEVIEEGKPMLLLFRTGKEEDRKFKEAIIREIGDDYIDKVNPLLVDASVMKFPMFQMSKTTNDCPILVIDQFIHTYVSPLTKDDIYKPGNIRKFVSDLLTDKLHKKLHGVIVEEEQQKQSTEKPADRSEIEKIEKVESVFKKLEPAKSRYSFAKQEL